MGLTYLHGCLGVLEVAFEGLRKGGREGGKEGGRGGANIHTCTAVWACLRSRSRASPWSVQARTWASHCVYTGESTWSREGGREGGREG